MLFLLEQEQAQEQRKGQFGPLGYVFVGRWNGLRWLFARGD
jgi:hypothetical protein